MMPFKKKIQLYLKNTTLRQLCRAPLIMKIKNLQTINKNLAWRLEEALCNKAKIMQDYAKMERDYLLLKRKFKDLNEAMKKLSSDANNFCKIMDMSFMNSSRNPFDIVMERVCATPDLQTIEESMPSTESTERVSLGSKALESTPKKTINPRLPINWNMSNIAKENCADPTEMYDVEQASRALNEQAKNSLESEIRSDIRTPTSQVNLHQLDIETEDNNAKISFCKNSENIDNFSNITSRHKTKYLTTDSFDISLSEIPSNVFEQNSKPKIQLITEMGKAVKENKKVKKKEIENENSSKSKGKITNINREIEDFRKPMKQIQNEKSKSPSTNSENLCITRKSLRTRQRQICYKN